MPGPNWTFRAFTTPKRCDTPNEDRWAVSQDGQAFAVSDGASVSYDPGPWAQLLVEDYVAGAQLDQAWLRSAVERYGASYDLAAMDWIRAGAFERGSFASLLGVRRDGLTGVEVTGVGDSIVAALRDGEVIASWPYVDPSAFDAAPSLLATIHAENLKYFETAPVLPHVQWDLADLGADSLILATDALGHWLLRHPEEAAQVVGLADDEAFGAWVEDRRRLGELRRDDTTAVVVSL